MKNLLNTNNGIVSRETLSFLTDELFDNFTPAPTLQEVPEILDIHVEVIVQGRIIDEFGIPLSGALVEMWHPLHYDYFGVEYGPAFAPTDPDAQGWACNITDDQGAFYFKTGKRPSILGLPSTSIDLKVTDENANVTLAKLYFDENIINPTDPFLMDMELEERLQFVGQENDGIYMFDIQL